MQSHHFLFIIKQWQVFSPQLTQLTELSTIQATQPMFWNSNDEMFSHNLYTFTFTKRAFIFLEPFPYNCYQLLQLVQLVQSWCAASGVGLDLCHCYQRRPGLWKGLGSSYTAWDKQTCSRINIPPTCSLLSRLLFFGTFCKDDQNKHVHSLTFQPSSLEEGELNHSIPALKLGISVGISKKERQILPDTHLHQIHTTQELSWHLLVWQNRFWFCKCNISI